MGTKNTPGAFDCYANLEPDEPHFVLMGRDPCAAAMESFAAARGKSEKLSLVNALWPSIAAAATAPSDQAPDVKPDDSHRELGLEVLRELASNRDNSVEVRLEAAKFLAEHYG